MVFVRLGYLNVAEFLIENGADVNAKGDDNDTPLMYAAQKGIQLIYFCEGMKINHLFVTLGCLDIAKLLIDNGADVNAKMIGDKTALMKASDNGKYDQNLIQISYYVIVIK